LFIAYPPFLIGATAPYAKTPFRMHYPFYIV
jgi:hypothetical protein